MRQRNDKETSEQSTPQVKNDNPINPKSLLQKKTLLKDVAVLPSHSFFRILSYRILLGSTSDVSNITGTQGTSDHILKILLLHY